MDGLIGRFGRHPETQFVLEFETRAHTKTHYHRYQLRAPVPTDSVTVGCKVSCGVYH